MTTASNAEVDAIFDEHQVKFPDLTEKIGELRTWYSTKMWHQMSDCLLVYCADTCFDKGGDGNELKVLYEKLIQNLNFKMNPLKYAKVTISCSRCFEDIEESIEFLDKAKGRMSKYKDACFLLEISQADKKLSLGKHHDCFEQLNSIKTRIEQVADVDPKVFSSLAHVYGLYYKRKDDHENYFKSCLQYLAYTPSSDMAEKEKKDLSIKMGMSILLGKNVFNITELLDKDVINSLKGTQFEWLYDMMLSLGYGRIDEFNKTVSNNQEYIKNFPNVVKEMEYLHQKVRIIALLEMIFEVNKDERSLPFTKIAKVCQIDLCDVELLIMKAMSLTLIKGTIDEVAQIVHIDWCLPRYLNKAHLEIMASKMRNWEAKLEGAIRLVEDQATELVNS